MDEYAKALDQVAAIAADRKVDAVLIAGDVFDSPAPPPEAEKLVYNFLARLVSERIQCVLIAGNHDHPRKLDALQTLLESLGIHVRHEVQQPPAAAELVGGDRGVGEHGGQCAQHPGDRTVPHFQNVGHRVLRDPPDARRDEVDERYPEPRPRRLPERGKPGAVAQARARKQAARPDPGREESEHEHVRRQRAPGDQEVVAGLHRTRAPVADRGQQTEIHDDRAEIHGARR